MLGNSLYQHAASTHLPRKKRRVLHVRSYLFLLPRMRLFPLVRGFGLVVSSSDLFVDRWDMAMGRAHEGSEWHLCVCSP